MTSIRRFRATDLFRFNPVNLDHLTENYTIAYYFQYLTLWPNCFVLAEQPGGHVSGYMMGKVEGTGERWHGHVSAISVSPSYRRLGVAELLMSYLEHVSDVIYSCYFVDLYVRMSNIVAVEMYKKFGYVVYRQVIGYYMGEEDAFDMRKACSRDKEKKSMIPLPHPVPPGEFD